MQTVQVVANHEIERETRSRELHLLPVTVWTLCDAQPFCRSSRLRAVGFAGSDVG
jgi:hypothetical protein